jgi:hypothetical protein
MRMPNSLRQGHFSNASVSQQLSEPHPVLLLHVSVVVFIIGSATGEAHGPLALQKVILQCVIEELAAIVTIEGQKLEGQV